MVGGNLQIIRKWLYVMSFDKELEIADIHCNSLS